jgi:hypothetical protein
MTFMKPSSQALHMVNPPFRSEAESPIGAAGKFSARQLDRQAPR